MYGVIYKVTNKENYKVYIGQTTYPVKDRWRAHVGASRSKSKGCRKFHNALRKYGEGSFNVCIIAAVDSRDLLDVMEIHFIQHYDTLNKGYNLASGGSHGKPSEESRKRMSDSQKRIGNRPPNTPESIKKSLETRKRNNKPSAKKGVLKSTEMDCPVVIEGIIYPSLKFAAKMYDTYSNQIRNWCRQKGTPPFECEFLFEEHKRNLKIPRFPRIKGDPKPCKIDGIKYSSLNSASKILKKDRKTLRPKATFLREMIHVIH